VKHLSTFAIDALALAALDDTARAAAEAHLAGCDRCRADRDAAADARAHFTTVVLPRTQPRPRRRWWLIAAPAVAAAVLVCFAMWPAPTPRAPELGIKGGPAMQVFVAHDDTVFALQDGETLEPGDRLRFVAEPNGARFVLIASIDGAGAVTTYVPYGGTESLPLDGAERIEVPGSIALDTAPGPERIFALFSAAPIAAADVERELHAIPDAAAIRAAHHLAIDASQVTIHFEKAP
jgi:hypothetical protein